VEDLFEVFEGSLVSL